MASKKDRFEIFKRDGFKCQYCGRTPPEVILELDHVIAKAEGGPDDINNYVTACFDCNRGKGKNSLITTPESLNSRMIEMSEKREQMVLYAKYLQEAEEKTDLDIQDINQTFEHYYTGRSLINSFKNGTLKTFLKHLPPQKIKDAIALAAEKFPGDTDYWANTAVSYFCGICWNWIKRPETRDW